MAYTAKELEKIFKQAARMRKGKEKYKSDGGYWDGGRCEWGGGHNLQEDCEQMAQGFGKIESLREIQNQLKACNNNQEYEAKKASYIRNCERILTGLQVQTSSSSSMFGICIIWADQATNKSVISKIDVYRKEITRLKDSLGKETYKWVQELKSLEAEKNEIEKRMKENKKKASDPNINPVEKALLLQLIEDDGKKLKANLEKQNQLSNKFKFNPEKYTSDLLNSIKEAIKKGGKRGGSSDGSGGNEPNPTNSDNSDSESDDDNGDKPKTPSPKSDDNQPKDWLQENKQLLLIGGSLLFIFYLLNQKKETKTNEYYDY